MRHGVFPRLIQVSGGERKAYMLSEELILHFIPKVFKGYTVREKSLIRATRNADIDADALYDEDLDYREFMADITSAASGLRPSAWRCPGSWGTTLSRPCASTWT